MPNLRTVQQVDTAPGGDWRGYLRRRRVMRPADDVLAPGESLDDMASREPGRASDKNHTVHVFNVLRSLFVFTFRFGSAFVGLRSWFGVRVHRSCSVPAVACTNAEPGTSALNRTLNVETGHEPSGKNTEE